MPWRACQSPEDSERFISQINAFQLLETQLFIDSTLLKRSMHLPLLFKLFPSSDPEHKCFGNMKRAACLKSVPYKGPFKRSVQFGSKNWKQAFRRSDFKVPLVVRMSESHL